MLNGLIVFKSHGLDCISYVESSGPSDFESYSTAHQTLNRHWVFYERGLKITVVKNTQLGTSIQDSPSKSLALAASMQTQISKVRTFLREQYPRRWEDQEFVESLAGNLESLYFNSDLIIVEDAITGRTLATMRVIASPYRFYPHLRNPSLHARDNGAPLELPVETFFETTFPRPPLNPSHFFSRGRQGERLPFSIQSSFELSSLALAKHPKRRDVLGSLFKFFIFLSFQPSFSLNRELLEGENAVISSLFTQLSHAGTRDQVFAYGGPRGRLLYSKNGMRADTRLGSRNYRGTTWTALTGDASLWSKTSQSLGLAKYALEARELVIEKGFNPNNGQILGSNLDLKSDGFFGVTEIGREQRALELLGVVYGDSFPTWTLSGD